MELAIPKNVSFVSLFFKFLHFWRENDVTKFLIDFLNDFFRNCRKKNNWEKIMSENNLQISRNSQKNNKSNKNQDFKKRSQEGPRNVHKYRNNRKSNKDFSC